MELTIEQLAPYLPYNLKVMFGPHQGELATLLAGYEKVDINYSNGQERYDLKHVKPILQPLSDLILPNHILGIGYRTLNRDATEPTWTLKQFGYLCKHHFDVFGLIEEGLAIDTNTLNNKK